jgi:hypothetical protein
MTVVVEDSLGNVVGTDNVDSVALAIAAGTGDPKAVLSCNSNVVTVSLGVAHFTGCTINLPGPAYELTATSGALTRATSSIFNVSSPPAPTSTSVPPPAAITVTVAPPAPLLPPVPAPVLKKLSITVSGGGTVTSKGVIACGGSDAKCLGLIKPGTSLKLEANASSGYRFTGWSGGCSGHAARCLISINKDTGVKATFAPLHTPSIVPASIDSAAFAVSWDQSVGSGKLALGGTIGRPASVSITLHAAGAPKSLLTEHLSLPAGKFSVSLSLAPGKLTAGAPLYPGTYVVSLDGKSGKGTIAPQVKPVTLTAPTAGIVSKAYTSESDHGPATAHLKDAKSIWVHFYYQTQPSTKTPITISWYAPTGRLVGSVTEPNRPDLQSRVGSTAALPKGAWRADLRSGTTVVKTVTVNVT